MTTRTASCRCGQLSVSCGRASLLSLALAMLVFSAPAQACTASGPDGYATGLIWKDRPSKIPAEALVLKIRFLEEMPESWGFVAKIVEGPSAMVGRRYRFFPERLNSCIGLGDKEGFIVVRRAPVERGTKNGPRNFLLALDYPPSFLNEVLRFFGGAAWRYPGNRSTDPSGFND